MIQSVELFWQNMYMAAIKARAEDPKLLANQAIRDFNEVFGPVEFSPNDLVNIPYDAPQGSLFDDMP